MSSKPLALLGILAGTAAILGACTEPRRTASQPAPAPDLQASIEWSDSMPSAGSIVVATVRIRGSAAPTVASYTGRIAFDSTGLRFVDETPITDGATRVSNPQQGLIRLAGVSLKGFDAGQLYAARFTVLRPSALASVGLSFDEMHTAARANARVVVTGAAGAGARILK